jgi:hypothetical protein
LYFSPCSSRLKKRLAAAAFLRSCTKNIEPEPVLVHRPPAIVQHAIDPDEHLVEVPGVSCPGSPSRSRLAKSAPNFRHQCRMLSCVTTMPRSAVSQVVPRLPNQPIEVRDSAGLRSLLFGLRVLYSERIVMVVDRRPYALNGLAQRQSSHLTDCTPAPRARQTISSTSLSPATE